jgi:hypothetical protein
MSSVGLTQEELTRLLQSTESLKSVKQVSTPLGMGYTGGLGDLQNTNMYAHWLKNRYAMSNGITRSQIITFFDMAKTLLTQEQKTNLLCWFGNTERTTVSQETYYFLQCLADTIYIHWEQLPEPSTATATTTTPSTAPATATTTPSTTTTATATHSTTQQ